jgi:hypothetical protein
MSGKLKMGKKRNKMILQTGKFGNYAAKISKI